MTRFYGSVRGYATTEATRQGSQDSGISAHPRGWDLGVKVRGYAGDDDADTFAVSITGGSHDTDARRGLADLLVISREKDGDVRVALRLGDPDEGRTYDFVAYVDDQGRAWTRPVAFRREEGDTAPVHVPDDPAGVVLR